MFLPSSPTSTNCDQVQYQYAQALKIFYSNVEIKKLSISIFDLQLHGVKILVIT